MKPGDIVAPQRLGHLDRDPRGYPVIATVARGRTGADFGSIDEHRKLVLATFDWCAVCGLPFHDEARWQFVMHLPNGTSAEAIDSAEAPVHEICGVYAAQACPFLSSPGARLGDDGRRGQRRPHQVLAVGYSETEAVDIRQSGLQDGVFVLHFAHTTTVDQVTYSEPEELKDRYRALLATEVPIELSSAEKILVQRFNTTVIPPGEDNPGATVTGAAILAGAGFAPNVFHLSGMKTFKEGSYATIASAFLSPDVLRQAADDFNDEATRAAAEWLVERESTLHSPIAKWRERGRRQTSGHTFRKPKPQGPGRTVPKNAPCPCGSGRKASRCHPAGVEAPLN